MDMERGVLLDGEDGGDESERKRSVSMVDVEAAV